MPVGPCKTSTISDVILAIGFGPAQIYTQILAQGIWVVDGVEFAMVTALARPVAHELHLSKVATATIVAVLFIGAVCGTAIGGFLGDYAGRRSAILLSYACVTIVTLIIVFVRIGLWGFAFLRLLLGISMGIGMPVSLALVSEFSPPFWREALCGMRGVVFAGGGVIAALIVVNDESSLQGLAWRFDLTISVIPAIILGVLALVFLHESPLFLAKGGQHGRAKEVLRWMSHWNSTPEVDVNYKNDGMEAADVSAKAMTCSDALGIIYNRKLVYTTCTLGFVAFVLNLIEYGTAYAEPRVFQLTHASVSAGWQLLLKYLVAMPLRVCAIPVGALLSRQTSLRTLTIGCATSLFLFAWTGGMLHRSPFLDLIYYASQYVTVLSVALGYLVVYQASVDTYPTLVSATGSASCLGCGRLGGMLAPYLFELLANDGDRWRHFYCVLGGMSVLATALCAFLPEAARAARDCEAVLEDVGASRPLARS